MRYVVPTAILAVLFLAPSGFAGDREDRARLEQKLAYYEAMLRDAQTETAAKHFVARILPLEARLEALSDGGGPVIVGKPPWKAEVGTYVVRWLQVRIGQKVVEKDITLNDFVAWTRRELPEALAIALTQWMNRDGGADVSQEMAMRRWETRRRGAWHTASYGTGSFIVKPITEAAKAARRARSGRSGARPGVRPPAPLSRDQWWNQASRRDRSAWGLAYFAENSGLFEVASDTTQVPCELCAGTGALSQVGRAGATVSYVCTECAGVGHEHRVRFR